jgi:hypothetical protein
MQTVQQNQPWRKTMLAPLSWRGIATSLLAAASVAAFLMPTQAQTPSGQPMTIGFGMALTGPLAGFGTDWGARDETVKAFQRTIS